MRPSFATRANLDLLEENYRRWEQNPESVDSSWSAFFEGFELGNTPQRNGAAAAAASAPEPRESPLQTRVDGLVYAYRTLGHTIARVDPLAERRPENPLLSLRELGFSEKDLDLQVSSKFFLDNSKMTLREMIARARRNLCRHDRRLSSSTSRIRAFAIGCAIGSNRVRRKHQASTQVQIALLATLARSGDLRNFPAHPLRRTEAVFASGRGVAHGDSRHDSATMSGQKGSRKFAWAWRIAAGSMCSRISCRNRSR